MKVFLILFSFCMSAFANETLYSCVSDKSMNNNPNIRIEGTKGDPNVEFIFDRPWVREEGTLPAGHYPGTLSPSPSQESVEAKLDTEKYFPNHLAEATGSYLDLVFPVDQVTFMVEAYVMWPTKTSQLHALIVNNMVCKHF